jgi:hypothetical protein
MLPSSFATDLASATAGALTIHDLPPGEKAFGLAAHSPAIHPGDMFSVDVMPPGQLPGFSQGRSAVGGKGIKRALLFGLSLLPVLAGASVSQASRLPEMPGRWSPALGDEHLKMLEHLASSPGTKQGQPKVVHDQIYVNYRLSHQELAKAILTWKPETVRDALMLGDACGAHAADPEKALAHCRNDREVGELLRGVVSSNPIFFRGW